MKTTTKRDKVDRTVENTEDDMTVLGSEAKPEVDSKHYTAAEFSSPFIIRTINLGENFFLFCFKLHEPALLFSRLLSKIGDLRVTRSFLMIFFCFF